MSHLPKYKTSIDEHVKTARQLLGIGGDTEVPAPEPEKIASAAPIDINTIDDAALIAKLAESDEGQAMLDNWAIYGAHLGNVKFAEDIQDEELMKEAQEGLNEFLVSSVGEEGAVKAAQLHANGADAVSAFLDAHNK